MTDPDKIIQLEARVKNLEIVLSQQIKTPVELLKEDIARHEANRSQLQIQKRVNERLKSFKMRPIIANEEEEKKVEDEARRTDMILDMLYQILDEIEPKSAPAENVPAPAPNGKEPIGELS